MKFLLRMIFNYYLFLFQSLVKRNIANSTETASRKIDEQFVDVLSIVRSIITPYVEVMD